MATFRIKRFSNALRTVNTFLEKNRKPIGITGGAALVGIASVGGYKGYKNSKNHGNISNKKKTL